MVDTEKQVPGDVGNSNMQWGRIPEDNFGYASDEERRNKRGLEDWELVEKIPESQKRVPPWFFAVIAAVLLVSVGLSYPFWGTRKGFELNWAEWGFGTGAAILYLIVFGGFVWYMVNFYGSKSAGRLDSDPEKIPDGTDAHGDEKPK
jgi:hypothetical protein